MSFWCLLQKTNKNKSAIIVVKSNFFVRFLGPRFLEELRIPKSPFEINWPLVLILNLRPRTTNSVFIFLSLLLNFFFTVQQKPFLLVWSWNVKRYPFANVKNSKVAGFESGLFQKLFKGYIFCFLGHLVGRYIFELSARETNLIKKRSVSVY